MLFSTNGFFITNTYFSHFCEIFPNFYFQNISKKKFQFYFSKLVYSFNHYNFSHFLSAFLAIFLFEKSHIFTNFFIAQEFFSHKMFSLFGRFYSHRNFIGFRHFCAVPFLVHALLMMWLVSLRRGCVPKGKRQLKRKFKSDVEFLYWINTPPPLQFYAVKSKENIKSLFSIDTFPKPEIKCKLN